MIDLASKPKSGEIEVAYLDVATARILLGQFGARCDFPKQVQHRDKLVCVFVPPDASDLARMLYLNYRKQLDVQKSTNPFYTYGDGGASARIALLPAAQDVVEDIVGLGLIVGEDNIAYNITKKHKGHGK